VIPWPILLQGIRIPSDYATNEIPISIKKSKKGERGQVRNIGFGKFLPKLFAWDFYFVTIKIIFCVIK
jgi:hypothetical protein